MGDKTEVQTDKWEPDYDSECCNCDQTPTVTAIDIKTGKINYRSDMCGPCTFGESDCIDPDNW